MQHYFDHEKLHVYQDALRFSAWVEEVMSSIKKKSSALRHLDEASTSIVLNIAEGNGRYLPADRCRFFEISRGSALECAGALDNLAARKHLVAEKAAEGKDMLRAIVSMLVGLIKSLAERVDERRFSVREFDEEEGREQE